MKGIFKYQFGGKKEKVNKIQASLGLPQTGTWNPETESKYQQKMKETGLDAVSLSNQIIQEPQINNEKQETKKPVNSTVVFNDYDNYVKKVRDLKLLSGKSYQLPERFNTASQQSTCIGGACAAIKTILPSFPQEYSNPDFLRKINNDEIKGISKITNTKDLTVGDLLQFGSFGKTKKGKEITHPSHASVIIDEGNDDFHGAYVEVLDTAGGGNYLTKRYYRDKSGNIVLPEGYNSLTGFRPDNKTYSEKRKDVKYTSQKNSLQKYYPEANELYKAKGQEDLLEKINLDDSNKNQVVNSIVDFTNKNRSQLMKDLGVSSVKELNELTKKSIGIIGQETEFGSPGNPVRWLKYQGEKLASNLWGSGNEGQNTKGLSEISIKNIPEIIRTKYNINTTQDLYDPIKANIANIAIMQINRDTSIAKRDMDKAAGIHNDYYGVKANTPKAQAYIKKVNEQSDYKNYKEPTLLERTQRYFGFKKGGIFKYKDGGIHIKPENKGKFNATKERTGKSTEELTHSKNPVTKKRAVFAQNAAKWKHELGGIFKYKKGGYLKDKETYVTKDGKETKRGLWSNVYLKNKYQEGGLKSKSTEKHNLPEQEKIDIPNYLFNLASGIAEPGGTMKDFYDLTQSKTKADLYAGIAGVALPGVSGKLLSQTINFPVLKPAFDIINLTDNDRIKLYKKYGLGYYDKWVKEGTPKI